MKISLLVCWNTELDKEGNYYIPYTHYSYLKSVSVMYDKVTIIAPVRRVACANSNFSLVDICNISFVHLPPFSSLLSAQPKVLDFIRAINSVKEETDIFYCRVPDPFCWMPSLITSKPVIMHFVGDTIDATKNNEKWSKFKKWLMITLYRFEYSLIVMAARRSRVYTNGFHLEEKLRKYNVAATAVISSTISDRDFHKDLEKLPQKKLTLVYVGFLRNAKGIKTIFRLIELLEKEQVDYHFNIMGGGEMHDDFIHIIDKFDIKNKITLHGHIDNRDRLNDILRQSDLFVFPSLSEGSPRVIIEAMAQGVPVVSTPVGSLPSVFNDREDIFFFDFNDETQLAEIISSYRIDPQRFICAREAAYKKVKENYTKESFITKIFKY